MVPNVPLPGYGQLDLRAGVGVDTSTISLFVDNLLNARGRGRYPGHAESARHVRRAGARETV